MLQVGNWCLCTAWLLVLQRCGKSLGDHTNPQLWVDFLSVQFIFCQLRDDSCNVEQNQKNERGFHFVADAVIFGLNILIVTVSAVNIHCLLSTLIQRIILLCFLPLLTYSAVNMLL